MVDSQRQVRAIELELFDLVNVASGGLEPDFQRAIFFGDAEPIGALRGGIKIPSSDERGRSFLREGGQQADGARQQESGESLHIA